MDDFEYEGMMVYDTREEKKSPLRKSREAVYEYVQQSYGAEKILGDVNVDEEGWLVYTNRRVCYCVREKSVVKPKWQIPHDSSPITYQHPQEFAIGKIGRLLHMEKQHMKVNEHRLVFNAGKHTSESLMRDIEHYRELAIAGRRFVSPESFFDEYAVDNIRKGLSLFRRFDVYRRIWDCYGPEESTLGKPQEDFFVLTIHWILSHLSFETFLLDFGSFKYGTVRKPRKGPRIDIGDVDILASSSFFGLQIAVLCTLGQPTPARINQAVAVANQLTAETGIEVKPIMFVYQRLVQDRRGYQIPVLDFDDIQSLLRLFNRGKVDHALTRFIGLVSDTETSSESWDYSL